jgi:hypothetical protein
VPVIYTLNGTPVSGYGTSTSNFTDTISTAWNYWPSTNTTTSNTISTYWDYRIGAYSWESQGWRYRLTSSPAPVAYAPPDPRDELILENRHRAHQLRKRVAARKARALLLDHLDDEQRAELETARYFHVETAGGRRRYRIRTGYAGNVDLVRDGDREAPPGGRLATYCAHLVEPNVPDHDHMLVQSLMLQCNEAEFLRMANVS